MRRIAALVPRGFVGRDTLIAAQAAAAERASGSATSATSSAAAGRGRRPHRPLPAGAARRADRYRAAGARAGPAAGPGRRPDHRPRPVGWTGDRGQGRPRRRRRAGQRARHHRAQRPQRRDHRLALRTGRRGPAIQPGMRAELLPDTVEREVHGTIAGRVLSVSPLPATREGMRRILERPARRPAAARRRRHRVQVALERDPRTPTGLRWSTSRGPDGGVGIGTLTGARIVIDRRRVLDWLLPGSG